MGVETGTVILNSKLLVILGISIPCDSAIPLVEIDINKDIDIGRGRAISSKEALTEVHNEPCMTMFIATLFV